MDDFNWTGGSDKNTSFAYFIGRPRTCPKVDLLPSSNMFVETYYVHLEISQRELLQFISAVPTTVYCLIATINGPLAGVFVSGEALEYLLNE